MGTVLPFLVLTACLFVACGGGDASKSPRVAQADFGMGRSGSSLDAGSTQQDSGAAGDSVGDAGGGNDARSPLDAKLPEALGLPCADHADCGEGWCVEGPDGTVCTVTCVDRCPEGWSCKAISLAGGSELTSVCVPKHARVCGICAAAADCGGVPVCALPLDAASSDEPGTCLLACEGPGARCPAGFGCTSRGLVPGAKPGWVCAPVEEAGCCAVVTKWSDSHCERGNEHGVCAGVQVCLGTIGWGPCQALIPAAEVCDGQDNDCDGGRDEDLGESCGCGDGECAGEAAGETALTCPTDCAARGDGVCSPGENPLSAPEDCCSGPGGGNGCGDGRCLGYGCGENPDTCPSDCGTACGNAVCERGENPHACPEDCQSHVCGNRVCEPADGGPDLCPVDCGAACGNCVCEGGEDFQACPIDCGSCGDGVCSPCLLIGEPTLCFRDCADAPASVDCTEAPEGSRCEDGDPCTKPDTCEAGRCVGAPLRCEEGKTCEDGRCVDDWLIADPGSPLGLEFWAVDLDLVGLTVPDSLHPGQPGPEKLAYGVVITNPGDTAASIHFDVFADGLVTPEAVSVPSAESAGVGLPRLDLDDSGIFYGSVRVRSDQRISLVQSSPLGQDGAGISGTSTLLPVHALGTDHFIGTQPSLPQYLETGLPGFPPLLSHVTRRGYLAVVAVAEAPTVVTVDATAAIQNSQSPGPPGLVRSVAKTAGPTSLQFSLEQGQVLVLTAESPPGFSGLFGVLSNDTDLTGTRVRTDHPVAVFAGHELLNVGCGLLMPENECCGDHIQEQVLPVSALGQVVVCAASPPRGVEPDIWRIVATDDLTLDTEPAMAASDDSLVVGRALKRGEWVEIRTSEDFVAYATSRMAVFQTAVGGPCTNGDEGGPALAQGLPVRQWRTDHVFATGSRGRQHALVLMRRPGTSIVLDGEPVTEDTFVGVGSSSFQVGRLELEAGAHRLSSETPFGAVVHGLGSLPSQAYVAHNAHAYAPATGLLQCGGEAGVCPAGACDPAEPTPCDDNDECTADGCDGGQDCVNVRVVSGAPCTLPSGPSLCHLGECLEPCAHARANDEPYGCSFFAADLDNAALADSEVGTLDAAGAQYALIATNPSTRHAALVTISNSAGKQAEAQVPAGGFEVFNLPRADVDGTIQALLAFEVESDRPIAVLQVNPLTEDTPASVDASQLIPRHRLGNVHRVLSAEQSHDDLRGFVTVVAVDEGVTSVDLEVTARTLAGARVTADHQEEISEMEVGERRTFSLHRLEVLSVQSAQIGGDLSGTLVLADKPVAVFSGAEAASVPRTGKCHVERGVCDGDVQTACMSSAACAHLQVCCADHLEEQVPPTSRWGSRFIATATRPGSEHKDVWRFLALEDDTDIDISPSHGNTPDLQAGDWMELRSSADFRVSARHGKPLLVARYLPSPNPPGGLSNPQPALGDPSMAFLVPTNRFRTEHVVTIPPHFAENRLHVVAPDGVGVELDGEAISGDLFAPVGTSGFSVARLDVGAGVHRVRADRPVSVETYGLDAFSSYAFTTGL